MDFHRLGVDVRFERIGRIGQRWQREGAGWGGGRGRRGGLRKDETWGCGKAAIPVAANINWRRDMDDIDFSLPVGELSE